MSLPPIPPPIEQLGSRPFSFYPPILNIEHNEWHYRRSTWSEMLVVNARDGNEVWISRRYLGEVSSIEEPVVIVGLTKELEYKAGSVLPHQRRVIEMPLGAGATTTPLAPSEIPTPTPVVGIRLETRAEAAVGRMIGIVMLAGVLAYLVLINATREGGFHFRPVLQSDTGLTARDDYFAVVRRLGEPAEDRSSPEQGALHYRALWYPRQAYYVILMGPDPKDMHYIGTLTREWKPVHSVPTPGMAAMLGKLPRF